MSDAHPEPKRHRTAGGVVLNSEGEMLILIRDVDRDGATIHEVRLPKGHIDPGETDEQAARREVAEESGYHHTEITDDLGSSMSEFSFRGRRNIRNEHYFLMRLTNDHRDAPQPTHADEALFQPQWLPPNAAAEALTYPSEKNFAHRAIAAVEKQSNPT